MSDTDPTIDDLAAWHRERLDNCHTIAAKKAAKDRDGWLVDAAHFAATIAALRRLEKMEEENAELTKALAVVRQSLTEQAEARDDPAMPILKKDVVDALREVSECQYAMAESRSDRVQSHGLSLLCDWQDRARALRAALSVARD